jgi:hypothetical protein
MIMNTTSAPALIPAGPLPSWDPIVTALREELGEYGRMMGLFDEQQRKIFAHDADGVSEVVVRLEAQSGAVRERRAVRTRLVRDFARVHGRDTASTLRQLLPEFPGDVQPLLEALIDEINHLVQRARQRHRQNQMLLSRLIELHRQVIPALGAQPFTKTYSNRGQVAIAVAGGSSATYRATG